MIAVSIGCVYVQTAEVSRKVHIKTEEILCNASVGVMKDMVNILVGKIERIYMRVEVFG